MRRKWLTLAVLTVGLGGLGHVATVSAQYLPTQIGAARMPDPTPCNTPTPNLVPGPITPLQAPPGPSEDLSLRGDTPSAFQCEDFASHCEYFFHAGVISLKRQTAGNSVIVFRNANDPRRLDTGVNTLPMAIQPALNLDTLSPQTAPGYTATAGVLLGSCALEVSGFYIPETKDEAQVSDAGRLNLFFTNPPLGFEGNNGLWRQADQVRVELETRTASAEAYIRMFNAGITGCEALVGVRYIDYRERLGILTDDDGLQFRDTFGRSDPNRIAEYAPRTINRIIAPQLGLEYQTHVIPGFALGFYGKAAAGVNLAETSYSLQRANGLEGLGARSHRRNLSYVLDAGFYADVYMLERLRLRGGYQALFLGNILEASDQVNYNLANPTANPDHTGNAFLHGPTLQLQFLF